MRPWNCIMLYLFLAENRAAWWNHPVRYPLWELVLPPCTKLFVLVSPMWAGIQDNSQSILLWGHAPMPTSLLLTLLQMHALSLAWMPLQHWHRLANNPSEPANKPTTGLFPLISPKYIFFRLPSFWGPERLFGPILSKNVVLYLTFHV